jgi:hypothetical protein
MDLVEVRPRVWMGRCRVPDFGDHLTRVAAAKRPVLGAEHFPVQLDLRPGRATTKDRIVYGFGRRFRLNDHTDEEGWAALRLRTERRLGGSAVPRNDLAAAKWLTFRTAGHWLDVTPPPQNDQGLVGSPGCQRPVIGCTSHHEQPFELGSVGCCCASQDQCHRAATPEG